MRLSWQQKNSAIEARRQRAAEGKDAAERQCEKDKDGDAYKDAYKKIEIDYRCNMARLNANSESIKADMARTFSAGEFMSDRLETILKAFQIKAAPS